MQLELFFQAVSESFLFDFGFQYMIHEGFKNEVDLQGKESKFRCFCPCGNLFKQWRNSNGVSELFHGPKGENTVNICRGEENYMAPEAFIKHLLYQGCMKNNYFHQLLYDYMNLMYIQHPSFQYILGI